MTGISLLLGWATLFVGTQSHQVPLAASVHLTLSTAAERFYERMPIPFQIVVRNATDEPIAVNLILKPIFRKFVKVLYRRLPSEFQALSYTAEWDWPGHPDFEPFRLEGRQRKGFSLSLAADPGKGTFIFDRPGEYEIRLICDVTREIRPNEPHDTLETPPLRIHVEPAPPSEAAALEDWNVDLAIFAQNDGGEGGPRFRQSLVRALKFMDAHPTSLYSELLRARSLETLELLRREGKELTELEREGYERLKPRPAQ